MRHWVAFWLRGLVSLTGRGALYLVLGTLAIGMGDPLSMLAGLLELGAGASCVLVSRPAHDTAETHVEPEGHPGRSPSDSMPRMAFRRRVLFGMDSMDSAELMSLCLELGLQLDARARAAALAALDPEQRGSISEHAFVTWWEQQASSPPPPPQLWQPPQSRQWVAQHEAL